MKLADRVINLKPSATLAVSAKAQALKAQGKSIISLSVGEPDFPTPKHICEAAKKAIDNGETRYTPVPGTPKMRKAVADSYNRRFGVTVQPENVLVGNGGKQCLYNLCQALLNPGDQALIPSPYWVSYPPMVELAGAKAAVIATSAENRFKVSLTNLSQNFTPKTRVLFLNSPSNPSGVCYEKEELDAIAAWAVEHNIIVLSDEIYDYLVYDGREPVSLISWWEKYPENFVIINGLAKSYAMTGWRVGYTIAAPDIIKAMTKLQGQSTSNICSVSQAAGVAALNGDDSCIKEMLASFEKRRNMAYSIVSAWPNVVCPRPDGAFYLFMDVHAYYNEQCPDSTSFCAYLLDKAGVAAVPGAAFGNDNCIRISYALGEEQLKLALDKIAAALFGCIE